MFVKNFFAGLVCSVFVASASNSATFEATSHFEGDPSAPEHSVWFSGSNPVGAAGSKPNHFLFENVAPGFGIFETNGSTATLTGQIANAAGQTYELLLNFIEFNGTAGYKNPFMSDVTAWTLYELDENLSNTLTYLGDFDAPEDGDLQSFDVTLRGRSKDTDLPLKAQFGIGANDKDAALLGLSSWITFTDNSGSCTVNCSYDGDINIVLAPVPLPATGLLLLGGLGGLGFMRRRKLKSAN